MSWKVVPLNYEIHVMPLGDEIEHVPSGKCDCVQRTELGPNDVLIVIHDALDGRLGVEWANEILR